MQRYEHSISSHMLEPHAKGPWMLYETASARIAKLEAEIQTRRLDYTEDCKRLDAKIAELEALLTAMTAERDSESRWAKHYSDEANELRQQLTAAQERGAEQQRIIDRLVAAAQGRKEA